MSHTFEYIFCQMFIKKPCANLVIYGYLYIKFHKSYKLFTQYTSYEVPYIAKSSTPK